MLSIPRMKVLIVGGGVAGLTLHAKLRQQGREPVLIEKAAGYRDIGYGIGLYPLGSCVFHGLGVYEEFLARGLECRRYEIADHQGEIIQGLDMAELTDNVGPMVMLARTDLIDVLREAGHGEGIRMGTTIQNLRQTGDTVSVTFHDGTTDEFDLVVGCDGIHSDLRRRVFGEAEVFDTGWTVWTWWGREGLFAPDVVREYWGRGFFFGTYPVPGRSMYVAGAPNHAVRNPKATSGELRGELAAVLGELLAHVGEVRAAFEDAQTLFGWPMTDVRADDWYSGRVVLCGDSATAFLPTAGVGASNALRSAAALADELSRTDAEHVPLALDLYVKRCRKLVEGNQDDSRTAARYMFVESKPLGWGRDQIVKHYPASRMIHQIMRSMKQPF